MTPSHSLGFTYDSLDRLTSTNRADGQLSETYHIDGFGNMLLQDNLHTMPNYSIDPNTNRLLLNNTDYTYDAAGMLRSTGAYGHTFDYDADGNLQVLDAGKRSDGDDGDWLGSQYGYYATGERSYKTFSVDCYKDYVTLGSQVFEENNLCGPTVSYIYADGSKIARIEGSTLKYTVDDYLKTASAEFSATGTLLWKGEFAPFGRELTPISSSTTNYKFTGKERDSESGLDYFGARYYNSNVGRWTIPDWSAKAEPVPYSKLDNPQTLNLYAYVGNNPITQVDADGHEGAAGAATLTLADAWAAGRAASIAGPEAAISTFVAVGWAALAANAEPSSGMTVPGYGPEVTPSNNLGNIFTRGNSAQNAKTGEPPQLKAGKEAHKNEPVRPGEQKEVKTADGKGRMDRYDSKKSHIREIKPNNSRGQASGTKQLEQYKAAQEQATGKPHTTELTLYDPKK